jgi:pilus assembly protein CpaE
VAQLSLAVYSERPQFVEDLTGQIAGSDLATISGVIGSLEDLAAQVHAFAPDALLLDTAGEPDAVLAEIANLPEPRPALLIAADSTDGPLILRAMRLGVREVIALEPLSNEIEEAIERIAHECEAHRAQHATSQPAKVIAVMGAKGGVGATSIACQTAFELGRTGARTALIDLNLPIGDVALHCDIQSPYSVANLVGSRAEDPTYVATLFTPHPSGALVLSAPRRIEEAERVRGDHIQNAIEMLRDRFDWIVLDVSRSWSEPSIRALDLADQILVVVVLDVPTLGHARNHLDVLERLGHTGDKVRVIANRFTKDDPLTPRDCEGFIGHKPDHLLPNDYHSMATAVNEGRLVSDVAPRSQLNSELGGLVHQLYTWCKA